MMGVADLAEVVEQIRRARQVEPVSATSSCVPRLRLVSLDSWIMHSLATHSASHPMSTFRAKQQRTVNAHSGTWCLIAACGRTHNLSATSKVIPQFAVGDCKRQRVHRESNRRSMRLTRCDSERWLPSPVQPKQSYLEHCPR